MDTQVLIVGAGPTGLSLACHLLRLGVRVRIIDKKSGFSTTSKAIGLQYRVSEILACMGVVDRAAVHDPGQCGDPKRLCADADRAKVFSANNRGDA